MKRLMFKPSNVRNVESHIMRFARIPSCPFIQALSGLVCNGKGTGVQYQLPPVGGIVLFDLSTEYVQPTTLSPPHSFAARKRRYLFTLQRGFSPAVLLLTS